MTWYHRAACRHFPELFIAKDGQRKAMHLCRYHCPVLAQCRAEFEGRLNYGQVVAGRAYGELGEVLDRPGGLGRVEWCTAYCRALAAAEDKTPHGQGD